MNLLEAKKLRKKFKYSYKRVDKNLCKIKALSALMTHSLVFTEKTFDEICGVSNERLVLALYDQLHNNPPLDVFYASLKLIEYYLPNWRDFSSEDVIGKTLKRDSTEVQKWIKQVFKRDNNTCQHCGSKSKLHAHHKIHWADCGASRLRIDNGITLCYKCHSKEHPELSPKFFKHDR